MFKKYKNTILASLGAGFEYYDFIIYGLMSVYLSEIFFHGSALGNQLYHFSIFSLGYVFRPLGGMVFGLVSDKYGRKSAFGAIILIMAIATLVIGLLPTSNKFINVSIIVLVLARILQGVAIGGEIANAITLVHESNSRDPVHSGIITFSMSAGNILAMFVLFLLSNILSKSEIMEWGWRIPFLLGGVLAFICYLLRKDVEETAEYQKFRKSVVLQNFFDPLKELLSKDALNLILAIILNFALGAFIVVFIYMPAYINQFFSYQTSDIYSAMTLALIASAVIAPMAGLLARKFNRVAIIAMVSVSFIVLMIFSIRILRAEIWAGLIMFMVIYQACLTLTYVVSISIMADVFKVSSRNTALAISYNIGVLLSSFIPALITLAIKSSNEELILVFSLCIIAVLALISAFVLYNNNREQHR